MHEMWGWRGGAVRGDVARALSAVAKKSGLEESTASTPSVQIRIVAETGGGAIVLGSGIGGDELARELSRTLGVGARFAKVALGDTEVSGSVLAIAEDGSFGADEDLDALLSETCEEWFEGKKYRSEGLEDLVSVALGMDGDLPRGGTALAFARLGSARVTALIEAIRAGAKWEKTNVGGRPAVRVVDAKGTRISVLSPGDMAALEAGVAPRP